MINLLVSLVSFARPSIRSKPNTRYRALLRPMDRVASHTKAHRVKKANSIVHVSHRNIFPVRFIRFNCQCMRASCTRARFNANDFGSIFFLVDTNCTYLFLATPNEQVTIVFDVFKVKADNANATSGAYG